ncbi:uncharacterized protein [Phaseolus vulgaris]|uniref:uncharacterized protein n=1 Tax=Phaseolus vulgaris TaxID=3885 RepID=UPI0035CA1FD4
MRNTRQTTKQREEEDVQNPTMQHILHTIQQLQEEVRRSAEEAREEQERLREEVKMSMEEALKAHKELHKINHELQLQTIQQLQEEAKRRSEKAREKQDLLKVYRELQRITEEFRTSKPKNMVQQGNHGSLQMHPQDEPQPFTQNIIDEQVPPSFMVPKITPFSGTGDPELHLMAFRVQMLISGGSDAVRCKMFAGTFTGIALRWFNNIPDHSIPSFHVLSKKFIEKFAVNKVEFPTIADLVDIRQGEGESLKSYLSRFCGVSIKIFSHENLFVDAFVKGLQASSFFESLIRDKPDSMVDVQIRATSYIKEEELMRLERKRHQPPKIRKNITKKSLRRYEPY